MRCFVNLLFVLIAISYAQRLSVKYNSEDGSYEVIKGHMRGNAAELWYKDEIEENGWGTVKIVTNKEYSDDIQAHAAGVAEGFAAYDRIYQHVSNIKAINFQGKPIPETITKYLDTQIAFLKSKIAHPPTGEEKYWRYVSLMMDQLRGLLDGYNMVADEDKKLSFRELYMHNADGDMETILDIYMEEVSKPLDEMECSALVRMLENGEILIGHTTWRNYAAMLRHYKLYEFNYQEEQIRLSFSASPGFINSKDDFYVNGKGIGSMETTNGIYNKDLYQFCTPDTVPSFIRSQVANMLANTPKEWVDLFGMYNSGTYNNQWMAVDLNGFGRKENVMYIIEQIPGLTIPEDVTHYLYEDGYWASYNIPYIREIYEKSGYASLPPSPDNDYYNCSRHNIFQRDAKNVKDLESMKQILRYNNYQKDPLSEKNPKHTISSRYDLFEEKPRHFGGIDSKVTSTSLNKENMGVYIANGPSRDGCPAFSWSEWMKTHEAIQHLGHPDVFDFDYIYRNFDYTV